MSLYAHSLARKYGLGTNMVVNLALQQFGPLVHYVSNVGDLKGAFSWLPYSTTQIYFSMLVEEEAYTWFLWTILPEEKVRRGRIMRSITATINTHLPVLPLLILNSPTLRYHLSKTLWLTWWCGYSNPHCLEFKVLANHIIFRLGWLHLSIQS